MDNVDFYCFPVSDDLVIYSTVMMFQRHHPLLLTMNEKIRAISESGLLSKWEKENTIVGNGNDGKNGDTSKGRGGGKQMKLRLEHVQGAFILLSIGIAISGSFFIFEMLSSRLVHAMVARHPSNAFVKAAQEFFCFA